MTTGRINQNVKTRVPPPRGAPGVERLGGEAGGVAAHRRGGPWATRVTRRLRTFPRSPTTHGLTDASKRTTQAEQTVPARVPGPTDGRADGVMRKSRRSSRHGDRPPLYQNAGRTSRCHGRALDEMNQALRFLTPRGRENRASPSLPGSSHRTSRPTARGTGPPDTPVVTERTEPSTDRETRDAEATTLRRHSLIPHAGSAEAGGGSTAARTLR